MQKRKKTIMLSPDVDNRLRQEAAKTLKPASHLIEEALIIFLEQQLNSGLGA